MKNTGDNSDTQMYLMLESSQSVAGFCQNLVDLQVPGLSMSGQSGAGFPQSLTDLQVPELSISRQPIVDSPQSLVELQVPSLSISPFQSLEVTSRESGLVTDVGPSMHKDCSIDCLCRLLLGDDDQEGGDISTGKDLDMEEIYQVLGRDILKSSLLEDIDLYLECDDDSMYVMPPKKSVPITTTPLPPHQPTASKSLSLADTANVCMRISFPQPLEDPAVRFKCDICTYSSLHEHQLRDHKAKKHNMVDLFTCDHCTYKGQSYKNLQRHVKRQHVDKSCTETTFQQNKTGSLPIAVNLSGSNGSRSEDSNMTNASVHVESPLMMSDVPLKDCCHQNICGAFQKARDKRADSQTGAKCLIQIKPDSPENAAAYLCKDCGFQCKAARLLKAHIVCRHNPERLIHVCGQCRHKFKQKRSLLVHEKRHKNELEFICQECHKLFASQDGLKAHQRSHNQHRAHVCSYEACGRAFKTKSALHEHVKTVHGEKLFMCKHPTCDKSYAIERDLKAHAVTHTETYKCTWQDCKKIFRDKYNLDCHFKTHTKVKDRKCPLCDFLYAQKSSLNWHMKKKHSGTHSEGN